MRQISRPIAIFAALLLMASFARTEETPGKTMMWKVTGEGNEIYLLGSIHVMKKEIYPLAKELEDAFGKSKFLVIEANEPDPASMQKMVMEKGLYPAGDGLSKHLSKPTQEALDAYLKKVSLPAAQLEQMRPWMSAIMLSMMAMMKMGFDPAMGIDKHFINQANESKKKILELESADFQLALLSGFSDDLQEKFLSSTLDEVDKMQEQMDKMVGAWSKGDPEALNKLLTEQITKKPEFKPVFEKMVDERNINMAKKCEEYLKTKDTYFVVAGAAHMVGEKGIVKLLQNKNYKVEQITASGKKAEPAQK
jgi:uncharacterized protein YbaP (TraB family)